MRPECWRDVLWLEMCSCEVSRCVPALVSSPGAPPLWTQDMAGAEHGRHLLSSSTLLEDSYHSQLLVSCWQLLSHVWWARIYVLHLCLEDENKWIWEKIMIMSGSNRCQQKYFLFAKSERILHHNLWTLLEEISCLVLASPNGSEGRRLQWFQEFLLQVERISAATDHLYCTICEPWTILSHGHVMVNRSEGIVVYYSSQWYCLRGYYWDESWSRGLSSVTKLELVSRSGEDTTA